MANELEYHSKQSKPLPPRSIFKLRHKASGRFVSSLLEVSATPDTKSHDEYCRLGSLGKDWKSFHELMMFLTRLASIMSGHKFSDYRKEVKDIMETIRSHYEVVEYEVREKRVYG